ncbi:MAG: laccase domain-containing protein [Clostridiales bacterium]|jgi:YfiH family protein|nr:laccase domain-containing protein [Clostridiales bacterium]
MFYRDRYIWKSGILDIPGTSHGFSTRKGGVSALPHTASMNVGFFRGDEEETVLENIRLFCTYAGLPAQVVCTPQIHSDRIRYVTGENAGEGTLRDVPFPCDGFVTDQPGITLLVRVADCAPVLLAGKTESGAPLVGAVHAGWRGTAAGIGAKAVTMLRDMGAAEVCAAVGACIHACCYQVGEEMRDTVAGLRGTDFARRYVQERDGKLYADIAGMNRELLLEAGAAQVDVCGECTQCAPNLYHSHRATGGVRGTMGAAVGIVSCDCSK